LVKGCVTLAMDSPELVADEPVPKRAPCTEPPVRGPTGTTVKEFDGSPFGPEYLSVHSGGRIEQVLGFEPEDGWCFCMDLSTQKRGWFPVAFFKADGTNPSTDVLATSDPWVGSQGSASSGGTQAPNGGGDLWAGYGPAPMPPASRHMCRVARHETHQFAYPRVQGQSATKIVPISVLRRALQDDPKTAREARGQPCESDHQLLSSFLSASTASDTRKHHGVARFARTTLDPGSMHPADEGSYWALQTRGEPCLIVRLKT